MYLSTPIFPALKEISMSSGPITINTIGKLSLISGIDGYENVSNGLIEIGFLPKSSFEKFK